MDLFIKRAIKLTVVIVKAYHCYYLHTKLCQILLETVGDYQRGLNVTDQLLFMQHFFVEVLEKEWECIGAVHQLLVGHTKACDSRREVLFNILILFGIP